MGRTSAAGRGFLALAMPALLLSSAPARALTVTNLRNLQVEWSFGQYAPGGDCTRQPRLTVDATGFTVLANGQTLHPARSEWAPDYVRGADDNPNPRYKVTWFFPFMRSDSDFGPLVLTLEQDRGVATASFENQDMHPQPGAYGALLAATPLKRCGGAAAPAPAPAPRPAARRR